MASLRIAGFVCVCFVFALISQATAGVHYVLQKCADQEGATFEEAKTFMNTGEATQGLKCAFKCIMQAANMFNDDGTLKVDVIVAFSPPEKADMIKKCTNFPAGDPCDTAYQHYKCALDSDAAYFHALFVKFTTDF